MSKDGGTWEPASPELAPMSPPSCSAPKPPGQKMAGRGDITSDQGQPDWAYRGREEVGLGICPRPPNCSQTKYDTQLKCHYPTMALSKLHSEFVTGAGGYKINLLLYFSKSGSIISLPVGCRPALN